MNYKCAVCGEKVEEDLLTYIDHTEIHIIKIIKARHPEWVDNLGLCQKCSEYFHNELKGNHS